MTRPSLVIISGPPAAGKSRLARPLARKLGLPLLQKDVIKEQIADAIGDLPDLDSGRLGLAAIRILYSTTLELLANGQSVVIESFFHKGKAEADLLPLLDFANACLLHVTADEPLLISRYERRMESPDRHAVHNDAMRLDDLRRYIAEGITEPLALPIPIIEVDTTYGSLDVEEIAFMVGEALSPED
ncbi:MAG TPA: AAA family ATPase [Thermomicrobiales bacterium]|nr:AAA family ATPase [Thermomicrobiales bacterium]